MKALPRFGMAMVARVALRAAMIQAAGVVAVAALCASAPATAQTITEFPISTPGSTPIGMTVGPDGALWFVEGRGNKIGRISTTGAITEYPLPTANSSPGCIVAGPDGALWFTEGQSNKIGRITTAGVITEFPNLAGGSPECLAVGPDGALWIADQGPTAQGPTGSLVTTGDGWIGRMTTAGVLTKFPLPTPDSHPLGIIRGPDDALWFTMPAANRIGRITTAGAVTEYTVPTPNSSPRVIIPGPDGALWFTEYLASKIGRITTSGAFTEFPLPADSNPFAIVPGPDGALWFTEPGIYTAGAFIGGRQKIGRMTTSGTVTEFAIPTANSNPVGMTVGPDGVLWFGEVTGNNIGRITLAAATPATPTPTTPLPPPQIAQTVFTAPSGQLPAAAVAVSAAGTYGSASLSVTLDIVQALQATPASGFAADTYNVYVIALVPGAVLGSASPVFFIKARAGWGALRFPVAPYLENVAQGAANNQVLIEILTNNDISSLVGTEFYIGYGTSDTEMLTRGRYRGIYKVQ